MVNNTDLNSFRLVRVSGESTLPKGLSHQTVLEYQNNIMRDLATANDSITILNDDKYKSPVTGRQGDQYSTKQYNPNAELNTSTPTSAKFRLDELKRLPPLALIPKIKFQNFYCQM